MIASRSLSAALLLLAGLSVGCRSIQEQSNEIARMAAPSRYDIAITNVRERVKPALVRIKVVEREFSGGREEKYVTFGSGTIISPDGYVMTNHHVAGKAVQLFCTMPNREEVSAVLIGTDPATDIAIIRLQPTKDTVFPFAQFGNSDEVAVGDQVFALGSPASLSQSVTLGIVSNTEMITPALQRESGWDLDGENVGELVRWIGHDAAIYPGNSGGPLVDREGRIIGVNEIGIGLGGAIPGNLARRVAQAIIRDGFVTRSYVGLRLQPLLQSDAKGEGVLVGSVNKGSPAEKAGLVAGDVLLAIDERTISGRFQEDLPAINQVIADLVVGNVANFTVRRAGGELTTLSVTTEKRQPALIPQSEVREWGMSVRDVSIWTQLDLVRKDSTGVVVTGTRPGGPAAQARPEIKDGDIIVRIGESTIRNREDFIGATKLLVNGKAGLTPVIVQFEREGENLLSVANVGIDPLQPPGTEVQRAWVPIETQVLTTELAAELKIVGTKGVRVTRLYPEAAESPFKVGDVIVSLDGDPIDASRPVDQEVFTTTVRQYKVGRDVTFGVLRDGKTESVAYKLLPSPARVREMNRYRDLDFEFVAREATFSDRQNPALAGQQFAVVADSVTQGGWAYLAGLGVGDAILQVDATPITRLDDVAAAITAAREAKARSVVLFVRRGSRNAYLEMQPAWK